MRCGVLGPAGERFCEVSVADWNGSLAQGLFLSRFIGGKNEKI